MSPPVRPSEIVRTGWECNRCKTCQVCRESASSSKFLLVCRTCDKAYHHFCTSSAKEKPNPAGFWKCERCRQCRECGTHSASQWNIDYSMCEHCNQKRRRANVCPLCGHGYANHKSVQCDSCSRWIHATCDNISDEMYKNLEKDTSILYVCKPCRDEVEQIKRDYKRDMKPELLEMEKDMAAVSANMKPERLESIYTPSSSTINTQCATVTTTNTWLTTEPVQWSRLRMTYSFEYAIMKQFGKVLL